MMMIMMTMMQTTWLSKLHEAQEKYQEVLKSRYREGGDGSMQSETVNVISGSDQPVTHGTVGPSVTAAVPGRGWLGAAGANISLIVPSFAVHDYGELVRTCSESFSPKALSGLCLMKFAIASLLLT